MMTFERDMHVTIDGNDAVVEETWDEGEGALVRFEDGTCLGVYVDSEGVAA